MRIPNRLLWLFCLCPLAACGVNRDDLANAMTHRCEMERLEREMEAQPESQQLRAEYMERAEFLRIVVEGAADPEQLRAAMGETPCE